MSMKRWGFMGIRRGVLSPRCLFCESSAGCIASGCGMIDSAAIVALHVIRTGPNCDIMMVNIGTRVI